MTQNQSKQKLTVWNSIIILLSIIGLVVCIAFLFPKIRWMVIDWAVQNFRNGVSVDQVWIDSLLSFAMGGIFLILFFNYCTLTNSGRTLVAKVKQEIIDCLSEIDFHSLLKPVLIMFGVYLLGILSIIRADFSYMDDLARAVVGFQRWFSNSRYLEYAATFVHGDFHLTDISPVPQLLAVLIMSIGSVFLVYVIGNKKITVVRLLASIPLGLFPYFLECLTFKIDAPYMALSVLASVVPFLFVARKKAFFFISVVSLLVMLMTYQSASGIYLLIVIVLSFQNWNSRRQSNKEILSFLWIAVLAFCFALLFYKYCLMIPFGHLEMYPVSQLISGALINIKNYIITINHDLGIIWKAGIVLVLLFFITKSMAQSSRNKIVSLCVSILTVSVLFIFSFGIFLVLTEPSYNPRSIFGFGVFLAIICVYVVSDIKKPAIVVVLALNWCLFTFAFSYGNALADQKRYADFRISLLLHDLSVLYPNRNVDEMIIHLNNSIDFAPTIRNISKNNPVIERLVPKRLGTKPGIIWDDYYYRVYFNYYTLNKSWDNYLFDLNALDLPVVLDSYYHTIQSDGEHVLVTLKR